MTRRKDDTIIIGKPPSQRKGNQWYLRKGNIMTIEKLLKEFDKSKPVSYIKVYHASRGGMEVTVQYWKTLDNGYMMCVDHTSMSIKIVRGFSGMYGFIGSSKKEFDKAYDQLMKILKK